MLTASKILEEIKEGNIYISDFNIDQLNPNSYNIKLANILKYYTSKTLDPHDSKTLETNNLIIPDEGIILVPGILYIGSTKETIGTNKYISSIDGRSSIGRLGIQIHMTAGFGDIGFNGTYTLEITVVHPVHIYPDMLIGQVYFEKPDGNIDFLYNGRYQNQSEPVASRINISDKDIDSYHYKK